MAWSKERTQQMYHYKKDDRGEKKPDSSKATTAKIIEIFETEPSFSGISGVVDSGKSTYVNKDLV